MDMWMGPWCQRTGPSPWGLNIVQGHLAFTVPLLQVGTRAEIQSTGSFSSSSGFLHPVVAGKEGRTLGRATPCYQKVQKVGCKAVLKMKLQMFTRRLVSQILLKFVLHISLIKGAFAKDFAHVLLSFPRLKVQLDVFWHMCSHWSHFHNEDNEHSLYPQQ